MAKRTVLPTPCVRAYLDAGVTWYPADAAARQRRSDALVARLEATRQGRRDAQARSQR